MNRPGTEVRKEGDCPPLPWEVGGDREGAAASNALLRGNVYYFSGGESPEQFALAVERWRLFRGFETLGHDSVTVYGEFYGGRCMGMKDTYGSTLKFVAFEVTVGDRWLSVPQAADVASKLGLEFVHFEKVPATIEALDAARARPSEQARRNGILEPRPSEGIVVRPLVEFTRNNGSRVIAKYKNESFRETTTTRNVVSPEKLAVLVRAQEIADEWVTDMRLEHVLAKVEPRPTGLEQAGAVIRAMIEDVRRESAGEVEWSKEAEKAIGSATAKKFKAKLSAGIGK
jgi:hypothetical protein